MIFMSNNQWKCDINHRAWAKFGEDCSAEGRVGGLVRAYQQVLPHVIGLQEVSMHMTDLMMEKLRAFQTENGEEIHYDLITGGDTPILYRDDLLLLLASGFFRYEESIPGLEGNFNNSGTKSYTWGVFEEKATGKRFALMSTHLWWKSSRPESKNYQAHSAQARAYQITQAIGEMEAVMQKFQCPGIILGDFNASMDSLCLQAVEKAGWVEAHEVTLGERDETKGHHYCFADGFSRGEPGEFAQAIDHIILQKDSSIRVEKYLRLTEEWFDKISDHYPLYIEATLEDGQPEEAK